MINAGVLVLLKLRQLVLANINHDDDGFFETCGETLRPLLLWFLSCVEEKHNARVVKQELKAWLVIAAMTWVTAAGRAQNLENWPAAAMSWPR